VLDLGDGVPSNEAMEIVQRDLDSVVRSWLVRWEVRLRMVNPPLAADLRRRLLNDPATGIRKEALFAAIAMNDPETADALRRALFDPAAMIRHVGRYHLKAGGEAMDFAATYHARLQVGERPLAPAILGFGETAKQNDWKLLLPFLDGSPRESRAALQAMARLDPEAAQDVFMEALADPRDGVCRQAFRWLALRQPEANADRLLHLWQQASTGASRRVIARAILRLPPWPALDVLLQAVASDPDGPDGAALPTLASWRPEHRAFYPAELPPEVLASSVRRRLAEMRDELPFEVIAAIERGLTGGWERKHAFR
jgi:HEAT repeat protein